MLNNFIADKISSELSFIPTQDQQKAIIEIVTFLLDKDHQSIFLLKGYSGTGKTSLLGALVKTMVTLEQKLILLAPTGRAAKVLAFHSNHPAFTIHKKIYNQQSFTGEYSNFVSADNLHTNTTFIVDEASMIQNTSYSENDFGTGKLLEDLIHYVYSGENCKLMLIGDDAQLPPIGANESPALSLDYLQSYELHIYYSLLSEVVRQKNDSGILYNATNLRTSLQDNTTDVFPQINFHNYTDIKLIQGEDLIDEISSSYSREGIDSTMIVTRSNKRANIYNQGIRNSILYREEELSTGDLLMLTKNNYFWCQKIENIDFFANGEIFEVLRVRATDEAYGLRFCNVILRSLDYDIEFEAKLLLDSLQSEESSLSKEKRESLLIQLWDEMDSIRTKREKFQLLKSNTYYNALEVKFAYAVTCHKAQGGEWMNIFVDIGYITEENMGISFYRWLYTAMTRATTNLFFVNLPKEFIKNK